MQLRTPCGTRTHTPERAFPFEGNSSASSDNGACQDYQLNVVVLETTTHPIPVLIRVTVIENHLCFLYINGARALVAAERSFEPRQSTTSSSRSRLSPKHIKHTPLIYRPTRYTDMFVIKTGIEPAKAGVKNQLPIPTK